MTDAAGTNLPEADDAFDLVARAFSTGAGWRVVGAAGGF